MSTSGQIISYITTNMNIGDMFIEDSHLANGYYVVLYVTKIDEFVSGHPEKGYPSYLFIYANAYHFQKKDGKHEFLYKRSVKHSFDTMYHVFISKKRSYNQHSLHIKR